MRTLRNFERLAWTLGLLLLASYVAVRAHGEIMKQQKLAQFDQARQKAMQESALEVDARLATLPDRLPVDRSLWSQKRIKSYEKSLNQAVGLPLAVLKIPTIDLEVPILDGTDDMTLNRAVGRIAGTAQIGDGGNIGIAGHRDGFFRGLKDVTRGDVIELVTLSRTETYVVEDTWIVNPDDVDVLNPTTNESITLVTCYPFYFVGSAPQRYVVRAVRSNPN